MEDEFWNGIVKRAAKYQPVNRRSQFSRQFNRITTVQNNQ